MVQPIDLKALERRAFRSTFQDGLMEIYLGLMLLSFGSGRLLDALNLSDNATLLVGVIGGMALIAGVILVRETVVIPRRGRVRFGVQRRRRQQGVAWAWIVGWYAALGILFAVGTGHLALGRWAVLAIFGAIIVLPFWLGAYGLQIPRLYAYGVLIAAALLIGHAAGSVLAGLITLGVIMIGIGIVLLVRFVREHPIPTTAEATNGRAG
jgi:hypothetical protein